jgi:hypothetical protein
LAQSWHVPYPLVPASVIRAMLPFAELPLMKECFNVVWLLDGNGRVCYRQAMPLPKLAVNQGELYQLLQRPLLLPWLLTPKNQAISQPPLAF